VQEARTNRRSELVAEVTAHRQDPKYLHEYAVGVSQKDPLPTTNNQITGQGKCEAQRCMSDSRAPGTDDVPPELLKQKLSESDASGSPAMSDEPPTELAKRSLEVLQRMDAEAAIPEIWNTAEVVPIPNGYPLTDMNNYRLVYLIPSMIKRMCSIVANRIHRALAESTFFVPEQVDFRSRQECMSHVLMVVDAMQRRFIREQQPTYACFIDFGATFVTVPHEALFLKMYLAGIRDRNLAFFRALYLDSWFCVRLGDGARTPKIRMKRGMREGDPSSPLLFKIFINDILDRCREYGVEFDCASADKPEKEGPHGRRLAGLIFVDKVLLLAPNPEALAASMREVSSWADRSELTIGASNCGVMVIHGDSKSIRDRPWRLQDKDVPIVDKYRLLRMHITPTLDVRAQLRGIIAEMKSAEH